MKQSVQFIGLIFVLLAIFNVSGESCKENDCQTPEKCDGFVRGNTCEKRGETCCQQVNMNFRTKCSQSQGHCTTSACPSGIRVARQISQDCAENEYCCVLVR